MSLFWILLYSKTLISVFFTDAYLAAAGPLSILIIGYFINGLIYSSRDILLLFDPTQLILKATIIAGISNIVLNAVLIPFFGMYGAATATATSLTLLSLIFFGAAYKKTKVNPFTRKVWAIILLTGVAAVITYITLSLIASPILQMILSIFLLAEISIGLIYMTGLLEKDDINMARTFRKKIKNLTGK